MHRVVIFFPILSCGRNTIEGDTKNNMELQNHFFPIKLCRKIILLATVLENSLTHAIITTVFFLKLWYCQDNSFHNLSSIGKAWDTTVTSRTSLISMEY